jgi:hypothetical protein
VSVKIHGELDNYVMQSGLGTKTSGFFQTQDGTFGRADECLDARTWNWQTWKTQISELVLREEMLFSDPGDEKGKGWCIYEIQYVQFRIGS